MGRSNVKSPSRKKKPNRQISLLDALFTSTQQRLLGLLFGNPNRAYFATEIIALAGAGSGTVQRTLAALSESGLVKIEQIGKQKYYQANQASPIFDELRQITLKTVGLAEPLTVALLKTGVAIDLALIYGSVAKGTDTATSDIDLLIVSDELSLEEAYEALEKPERMLGRKVSPTLYTTEEFKGRLQKKNAFVEKVLAGEHMVLIGENDAIKATR